MAIEPRNPYGAVQIADGGTPRVITVLAYENISGGYWVNGSGEVGLVGSGADSYAANDIRGTTVATQIGSMVIGLALTDIGSNTYGPVAMRGLYLMPGMSGVKIGSVFAGQSICAGSAGTIIPNTSGTHFPLPEVAGMRDFVVGRSLTAGGHGSFSIISLNI